MLSGLLITSEKGLAYSGRKPVRPSTSPSNPGSGQETDAPAKVPGIVGLGEPETVAFANRFSRRSQGFRRLHGGSRIEFETGPDEMHGNTPLAGVSRSCQSISI